MILLLIVKASDSSTLNILNGDSLNLTTLSL